MSGFEWPGDERRTLPKEHKEHIVIGPPGTGKTTWLTRQVQAAVKKYSADTVVVGSLTRAAAAEVAGRDTGIPRENIGTLHAHAFRMLGRPALAESPEGIKRWNEQCGSMSMKLSGGRVDPEDATTVEQVHFASKGDELLQTLAVYRAQMRDPRFWKPEVVAFSRQWEAWKKDTLHMDFTDLIERAAERHPSMPTDPAVILLDEAQDMSALEMKLARQWGGACEQLVIVGDPDQCLYAWRGASPGVVFGHDTERIITLSQSYRVPQAVHQAAVKMIERIPDRLPIEYKPRANGNGPEPGELQHASLVTSDPEATLGTIQAEVDAGRTVMILTTCGYMLRPLVAVMKDRGVPFHNPYRADRGDWNPLAGARRLLAFLRPNGKVWPDGENRMWTWDDLRLFTEPMQAKGNLVHGSKALIDLRCEKDQFGESRKDQVVPINKMLELFEQDARVPLMAMDVDWWQSSLKNAEQKRAHFAVEAYKRGGGQALKQTPKVIVGTIHSVKGGEADTVILFPDLSGAGYWEGLKRHGEQRDGVIRQFYVGMTRARQKLILCNPSGIEHIEW